VTKGKKIATEGSLGRSHLHVVQRGNTAREKGAYEIEGKQINYKREQEGQNWKATVSRSTQRQQLGEIGTVQQADFKE